MNKKYECLECGKMFHSQSKTPPCQKCESKSIVCEYPEPIPISEKEMERQGINKILRKMEKEYGIKIFT